MNIVSASSVGWACYWVSSEGGEVPMAFVVLTANAVERINEDAKQADVIRASILKVRPLLIDSNAGVWAIASCSTLLIRKLHTNTLRAELSL